MLHADMILLKNFTVSGDLETPSCAFSECPNHPVTSSIVSKDKYSLCSATPPLLIHLPICISVLGFDNNKSDITVTEVPTLK